MVENSVGRAMASYCSVNVAYVATVCVAREAGLLDTLTGPGRCVKCH
jgi:hypothetical protein